MKTNQKNWAWGWQAVSYAYLLLNHVPLITVPVLMEAPVMETHFPGQALH